MFGENLPEVFDRYGKVILVADAFHLALKLDRDPTVNDISYEGRLAINRTTLKVFILIDVSGLPAQSNWKQIADGTPDGTNGQLLIGKTGLDAAWANLTTDGTILITEGVGAIGLSVVAPGSVTEFQTDAGNAAPVLGVSQFAGGTNIGSTGAGSLVTYNLDPSIALAGSLTAGTSVTATTFVTAGANLNMLAGICTITSDTGAADDIYLHCDGGVNETLRLHVDRGTGAASLALTSDVGGIAATSGLAAANAIRFNATAGGIDIDWAANSCVMTGANAGFTLVTGTGNISLGADAAQKDIVIGNATGTSSVTVDVGTGTASFGASATAHDTLIGGTNTTSKLTLQSGTGDLICTSTDAITLNAAGLIDVDSAGALSLNSSAAPINIGDDPVAQNINVGTGAAARTITIGNATGATTITVNSGTGTANFASNATQHDTILGSSTGNSATAIQTGTGDLALLALGRILLNSAGITDIDSAGILSLNSSTAIINIGDDDIDQNINIGTSGERVTTIGNIDGVSGLVFNAGTGDATITTTNSVFTVVTGTGNISLGVDATDHDVAIGSATGVSDMTLTAGTGGMSLVAAGIVDVAVITDTQAAVAVTVNANVGSGVFTGPIATVAAASQVFTITNALCTVDSKILCTMANKGANDAQMTITRVVPGAGSFTVTGTNNGAQTNNGDIIITFWLLQV